jgi:hypothetical protein
MNDPIQLFLESKDVQHRLQSIDDLSLKDASHLITLIRSSATFSAEGQIGPITDVPPIFPKFRLFSDLNRESDARLDYLLDSGLVSISPSSSPSAFKVVDNEIKSIKYQALTWKVHLENFESTLLQLNEIITNSAWPTRWKYEIKAVWLDIAVSECIEYLESLAYERDFVIEISDDLPKIIYSFLLDHSVSQCFSLLKDAARETSDNTIKNSVDIRLAGCHLYHCCLQKFDRPSQHSSEVRPTNTPQSQLSQIFYYDFLKIGTAGFTSVPYDVQI